MAPKPTEHSEGAEQARTLRAVAARGGCCREMIRANTEGDLLRRVCRCLVGAGYTAAAIHLRSEESGTFRLAASAGVEAAQVEESSNVGNDIDPDAPTGPRNIRIDRELDATADDDSLVSAARDLGGRAVARLWVRIGPARETVALLSVFAPETDAFDGEEAVQLKELVLDLEAVAEALGFPRRQGGRPSSGFTGLTASVRAPSARAKRQVDQALREQLEMIRSITDSAQDAILMIDDAGKVSYWNRAAQEIFGWTADEALGRELHPLLMPKQYYESFVAGFAGFVETGDGAAIGRSLELSALRKDGSEFPIELSLASVRLRGRWQAVGILRDITERKQVMNDLEEARQRAEAAAEAKSLFLATVSHELRTPLNAIIGMTDLLLDTDLDPQQHDFARTVRRSGEILLSVINDILDFSKIGAGRLEFESIVFSVRSCIEDVGDLLAQKAAVKGIELVVLIDHQVPRHVTGDPGRLRQVITNLVNNAIKFTEKGEVVVTVRPAETDDHRAGMEFIVEDTGIGIPADRIADLFQPFTQADASTTRHFGGTGLGLSIARRLVERMGGKIEVESREGGGSSFRFTAFFDPAPEEDEEAPIRYGSLNGLKVLIVDDNKSNRRLLEELLGRWGCTTESAASGSDALDLLLAQDETAGFDLAILDFSMPGMDGATLAAAIKADPRFSTIPLILLTSMPEYGDGERMRKAGFAAYLTKPIKQSYLYDGILSVVADSTASPAAQPDRMVTRHTLSEARRSRLHILVAEDNLINQKVAARMLEHLGYRCDLAQNGQEAVAAIEHDAYDVVLMDCQMPVMDGFEATRRIREREKQERDGRRTRIIAVTAEALEGDRERCLKAGMDDYISKPIDIEELAHVLEPLGGPSVAVTEPVEEPGELQPVEISRIRKIARGDLAFQRRIITLFLQESEARRRAIEQAVGEEDLSALRAEAHALKGGASNIGADRTAELAGRLQSMAEAGNTSACLETREQLFGELDAADAMLRQILEELEADDGG